MQDWLTGKTSDYILIAQAHPAASPEAAATNEHTATTTHAAPSGHEAAEHGEGGEHGSPWAFYVYGICAFFIIVLMVILGTRRMRVIPKGLQNFLELVVESLYGIPELVMGPRGRKYAPFACSFFIFIATVNLLGLIPFFKAGTASLSVTAGLAIVAFFGVQYFGFREHGWRYILHFAGPVWWLAWLIMPLELLSEVIRPVSLSFRLFGNIYGEEQVIEQLAAIQFIVPVLLLPLQVMTCILQAFVFTLLVTVYISLATEKHDNHDTQSAETSEVHAH